MWNTTDAVVAAFEPTRWYEEAGGVYFRCDSLRHPEPYGMRPTG